MSEFEKEVRDFAEYLRFATMPDSIERKGAIAILNRAATASSEQDAAVCYELADVLRSAS